MGVTQAKREGSCKENQQLNRLVADLVLDKAGSRVVRRRSALATEGETRARRAVD
jgi:hypothetical protein